MKTLLRFPQRPVACACVELRRDLRGKQRALSELEEGLITIAEAVWPAELATEAPERFRDHALFEVPEVVASVQSLHELIGRLLMENEKLRDRLQGRADIDDRSLQQASD